MRTRMNMDERNNEIEFNTIRFFVCLFVFFFFCFLGGFIATLGTFQRNTQIFFKKTQININAIQFNKKQMLTRRKPVWQRPSFGNMAAGFKIDQICVVGHTNRRVLVNQHGPVRNRAGKRGHGYLLAS